VPVPVPVEQIARKTVSSESISEKIAELELRLREDRRNEIVEKILQKNAAQQQKHLLFLGWLASLKQFIELLRSYGKSILHTHPASFSEVYLTHDLKPSRKIHL
ncbi:relaxase, partial [Salmonella enterica subsp. enterica serovar Muenchen]